jgi:hypothetical protein
MTRPRSGSISSLPERDDAMNTAIDNGSELLAPAVRQPRRWFGRSFGDPRARLWWRGNELMLELLPATATAFGNLYERGVLHALTDDGWIPPVLAVEEHLYRVAAPSRIGCWFEFSPKMWQAAALHLIGFLEALAESDLTLRNPHPWFLQWNRGRPVFVNPGAIIQYDQGEFRRTWEKVCQYFIRPLVLMSEGRGGLARRATLDMRTGIQKHDLPNSAQVLQLPATPQVQGVRPFLAHVKSWVETLVPSEDRLRWSGYQHQRWRFEPGLSWQIKENALRKLIARFEIRSVTDLAANAGHYSHMAARSGCDTVAAELDETLVSEVWEVGRNDQLPLHAAVLDFTAPSPGLGVGNDWLPPATDRYRSELVLAFALAHHLVFGRYRLNFEEVARGVRSFSSRFALVEYCPPKSPIEEGRPDAAAWYSLPNFAEALKKEFGAVQVYPASRDNRQLIFCHPKEVVL